MAKAYPWRDVRPSPCIGVDEAGRGCLAGPVVAGAVILSSESNLKGITDSKLLSEVRREILFERIISENAVGIGVANLEEIEKLNILHAAMLAMKRAVENLIDKLPMTTGHVLVDGNRIIPGLKNFRQTALVQGDLRALPISAASICAKVFRDRYMREMAKVYPDYGFERHKGYPTKDHKRSIAQFGATEQHRRSFEGVREYWDVSRLVLPLTAIKGIDL